MPCPIITCGDNAPNAGDSLLFDALDLSGGPNYAGVHLDTSLGVNHITNRPLSATLPGVPSRYASIEIQGDKLEASDEWGHTYVGRDLIGTVIRFRQDSSGQEFELRVACYNDTVVTFRTEPAEFIPVYDFQARRLSSNNQDWFEVCNQVPLQPDDTWTIPLPSLVYRGDEYVPGEKRVKPYDPSTDWSFIACNGSAGSKMHLFRHTHAGGIDDVGKRTTLLKAITADYCGDGLGTYTVPGHRLAFAIGGGATSFPGPYDPMTPVEAIWGSYGAACIDYPRFVPRPTIPCSRPFCYLSATRPPRPDDWTSRGHVLTATPPSPL